VAGIAWDRSWRQIGHRALPIAVLAAGALIVLSAGRSRSAHLQTQPGPQPNGATRLISGWTITPAGYQVTLATAEHTGANLPLAEALSPDGGSLIVLNGGAGIESLQVVDTRSSSVVQSLPFEAPDTVFQGLAFSPDGSKLFVTGGGTNLVHAFSFSGQRLADRADGSVLLTGETDKSDVYPMDLAISPDGTTLWVVDNLSNDVRVVSAATLAPSTAIKVGRYPYGALASPDGRTVYVSNWDDGTVSVIDTASKQVSATIDVGTHATPNHVFRDHPTAMALGADGRLYVALANADAVAVVDTARRTTVGFYNLLPYDGAAYGASPQSLALSPDGSRLFVANAGDNDVAVIDLASGSVAGLIPTAWYPTAVTMSLSGDRLYVANGKGYGAGPNNSGRYPNPNDPADPGTLGGPGYDLTKYAGSMIPGTLSVVMLDGADLAGWTSAVRQNDRMDAQVAAHPGTQPLPVQVGGVSPIKHVIYIIKENRTYDQVFGDIKQLASGTNGDNQANGDSSLVLFPKAVTPNQHNLTSSFVLFDNFYDDAEVSASGHNWSTGANATDYNERTWPQDYSLGAGRNRGYDYEGSSDINLNPGGYLWDAVAAAGLSMRNYGEFDTFGEQLTAPDGSKVPLIVQPASATCPGPTTDRYTNPKVMLQPGQVACFAPQTVDATNNPNLAPFTDSGYRHYDNDFPDVVRFQEWNAEFQQYVAKGNLPALEIMRFSNDHTQGAKAGAPTPTAEVHDNDAAVGMLVDAVSHSPYWKDTAIFVIEDDAQDGPDHVDAHRSTALAITPYTAHAGGFVDHTQYDTASMLRTMELILGLPPMSQFDAAATPMSAAFMSTPDLTPYTAIQPDPAVLAQRNPAGTAAAALSETMDFSVEDRPDPHQLNQVIWSTVKGKKAMPAPQHKKGDIAKPVEDDD
jgi:YVTN family beta-propeller protein